MSSNYWHAQPHHSYGNNPPSSDMPVAGSTYDSDPLESTHRLLTAYPLASATPTAHVTRHLSNLSLTAAPPSYYIQPISYNPQPPSYTQYYSTQYTEYSNELNYLNNPSDSPRASSYWETARSNAARLVGQQDLPSHYSPHSWQSQHAPSNYQSTPFAQSVFQQTAPSALYPTPPPPGISTSSSSLAFALGEPTHKPSKNVYRPAESAKFFDNFLAHQTAQLQQPKTPHRSANLSTKDSPDPLAFSSPSSRTPTVTPYKRKAAQLLESSPAKRTHSNGRPASAHTTPKAHHNTKQHLNATLTPKQRMQVYVELPPVPKSFHTPSRSQSRTSQHSRKISDEGDDLGGFGSDEGDYPRNISAHSHPSSGRATGERDDRAPSDKLITLIEDIFEAEDALAPDAEVSDLPTEFFSPLTTDCSRPLLHPNVMRKLTNYVGKVARPTKRLRISSRDKNGVPTTPKSKNRMSNLETATLSRILRMLDRSVKAGEDLDPYCTTSTTLVGGPPTSPVKARKQSGAKQFKQNRQSQTPKAMDGDVEMTDGAESSETAQPDCSQLRSTLDAARDSVLAADCCIAILS